MSRTYTAEFLDEAFFDVDTPASEFGTFETFVALWHSKRHGRTVPSWQEFEFEDFQGWHGWVCVFEIVEDDEFDLFARLWGTNIVRLLGFEMTGKFMRRQKHDTGEEGAGYDQDDMDFWQTLKRDCVIGVTDGRLSAGTGRYVRYKDIFLPLSTDGETVDVLLSATFAPGF